MTDVHSHAEEIHGSIGPYREEAIAAFESLDTTNESVDEDTESIETERDQT